LIENRCPAQDSLQVRKDSLSFIGQASAWGIYSRKSTLPLLFGGRYIPTLNYGHKFTKNRLLDFEGSANIFGSIATHPFDTASYYGDIQAYRAWVRYSSSRWELRLGLQKISFGSSYLFRPLMWFDQIDPRDPLKLTNGVWGLLSRYYFKNNANLWLWCLYGNTKPRPWDIGKTNKYIPELGGRFQHPIPTGEIALSYHFRMADTRGMGPQVQEYDQIPENRIGLDTKVDLKVGLWFEGTWITKSRDIGELTNQEIFCFGADYTFGIGNGIYVLFEQLLYANGEQPFQFLQKVPYSGFTLTYPIGIVDNLSAIIYYDWDNNNAYNFINWNHNFRHISFYLMGYWNPEQYNLPQNGAGNDTFAGPGIQVMLVYNH
jgi:hypothetical protein